VNNAITAPQVRVIDPDGTQLGIMPPQAALEHARTFGLDLVEVAPTSSPPVCRIMDYGKYKYTQSKKVHEGKKKQAGGQMKEVRMRPKTEEHDFQVKLKNIERFLKGGYKTKVSIVFRGRELAHKDLGHQKMERIIEEARAWGAAEYPPKFEGRSITVILAPN